MLRSLRDRALLGLTKGEMIDALSASRLGRTVDPFAHVLRRNGAITLGHEGARVLAQAFSYARSEQIPGAYAEFGVWTGRTFVEAWRAGKVDEMPRRYFAYDSFEGLPEVEGADQTGRWETGEFSHSRRAFEARLRRARVPSRDVEIVEGFFDATLLPTVPEPREVAIAWVDCDLYVSTVPVLCFLTDRLSQGAIILFDDWFCFKGDAAAGEQKACNEWLARNPQISLIPWRQFNWAGQAFIVRRAEGQAAVS
ncbi:MAG: class I SAM-dependent methyltransferase [Actinobacteria bacterium]|nr:class I SAM-dependent methyltransferase [Actinomycetota bacterium]